MRKIHVILCLANNTWTSDIVEAQPGETDRQAVDGYQGRYEKFRRSMCIGKKLPASVRAFHADFDVCSRLPKEC